MSPLVTSPSLINTEHVQLHCLRMGKLSIETREEENTFHLGS